MIKLQLSDKDKQSLSVGIGLDGKPVLIAESMARLIGHFKAVSHAAASTSTITAPDLNGSIQLTDLIVTSDKVQAATVCVRFYDDTRAINIFLTDVSDAPCNVATPFVGTWKGWKNARLELVTVGTVKATVACGYVKIPSELTLPYEAWDAER